MPRSSEDSDRLAAVKAKLAAGTLRAGPHHRAAFGKGSGRHCDACERPITVEDVEVTADFADGQSLCLHGACFESWRGETPRRI